MKQAHRLLPFFSVALLAVLTVPTFGARKDGPKPADRIGLPDFEGVFRGTFHVLQLKAEVAQKLLPAELELAPQDIVPAGFHPAIVIPGHQSKVHYYVGKLDLMSFQYNETIFALPFTRFKDPERAKAAPGPFYFMPYIYLDNQVPLLIGKHYGLNKKIRDVVKSKGTYVVYDREGQVILRASSPKVHKEETERFDESKFVQPSELSNFTKVRALIEQPLIGRRDNGEFVCTVYNWAGQKDFLVNPVESKLELTKHLGILPTQTLESVGLAREEMGSFDFISKWNASGPYDCSTLRSKSPQKLVD